MKKFTKAAAVVMMLALMTGCGSSGDATTAKPAATEGTTAAQAEKTTTGDTEAEKTTEGSEAEAEWYFQKGEVKIHIGDEATALISALGNYSDRFEEKSCAFEGMDVTYTYPSFMIITAKKNGESEETVSQIVLRDDTVETPEGVYIGSSVASVEKAYNTTVGDAKNVRLNKGNSDLLFIFDEGVVGSIQYLVKEE